MIAVGIVDNKVETSYFISVIAIEVIDMKTEARVASPETRVAFP